MALNKWTDLIERIKGWFNEVFGPQPSPEPVPVRVPVNRENGRRR